ncbi:molybdenum cofactor biosynthesis protein B [Agreia sp. Leaf283]|uniref:MogA/MoaB family molybdenum cofactor biosynthesis protein n=1 Tax=Agreia sp. Leaf283 TaxID=1736321 RepID=UPI0006F6EFE7|nr:MogA/MoaB family molybdenum cofactor biosynthesis protein [Agreia sp. Leaf283]KQP54559.1 molybdenum cofactor biosynthesis protein [Agreia sp. Leaf283]
MTVDAGESDSSSDRTRTACVIVASTRAATGVYDDRTGPVIAEWLRSRGWAEPLVQVVPDGEEVAAALQDAVASGVDLVVTTGGTGVNPSDRTPEATLPLLDRELPGVMEAIRLRGSASTPLAALSRGHAGIARGTTFVVNLPGSTGGVKDGLAVLDDLLDHVIDQLHGGDHER